MGIYNPSAPIVLGEEWVGIRDEDITLSSSANFREIGHAFPTQTTRAVLDARFYVNELPGGSAAGQTFFATIYEMGEEDQTGPIRSVIIPCNNGGVTGGLLVDATTIPIALANPSDSRYVSLSVALFTSSYADAYFAVNNYAQELQGKRILGVNVLYALAGELSTVLENGDLLTMFIINNAGSASVYGVYSDGTLPATDDPGLDPATVYRMPLGEVDTWWSTTLSPASTSDRMPWTYASLQRFEASHASRHALRTVLAEQTASSASVGLHYMALEVLYCEENRVAVGGRAFGTSPGAASQFTAYTLGQNIIPLRTPVAQGSVSLTAGNYLLTLSSADVGASHATAFDPPVASVPYPSLNGLRELAAISPHVGVQVNIPFPMDDRAVDKTLTSEQIHVLPQLSLHVSGAAMTEPHVYGRQAQAPVYGTITATQEILDSAAVSARDFPQVRFYARNFGDTSQALRLSSSSFPSSAVSIDPVTFDELDEVVDGWKEVTLRFPTAPTMGAGTNPQWQFSAAGETAGNQWQVLGMTAPALSGIVGNLKNLAPQQLSSATYGAPSAGSTINLGWKHPAVTATTDDETSDAALLFSTDPAAPSNFTVSLTEQELSTVDPNCPDFAVSCVPSILYFNQLTWDPASGAAYDDFNDRTVVAGWGSASRSGGPWTVAVSASDFSVDNGTGKMLLTSTTSRRATIGPSVADMDVSATFIFPTAASGGDLGGDIIMRWTDSNNTYLGRVRGTTTGSVVVNIDRRVAAAQFTITPNVTMPFTHTAGTRVRMRMQAVGTTLRFKAWIEGTEEPPWTVETTDTSFTTGQVGVRGIADLGNLNIPVTVEWDDFVAAPFGFGAYEIQRYDTVDAEFSTIANITTASIVEFNDYEARVEFDSVYRIRQTNLYDFAGLWSPQVTGAITAPGVVGADTSLLILTTNSIQDGSSNLAYSSAWEGSVSEDYQWPEANDVALQNMYGKDFPTAFRPLERGGERFTRNVLINAAGVPPVATARGFKSLRDLAWETVPYVCVRDETGERWYSTLIVPSGNMRRMIATGRLCLAQIQVIEVTDTPYPVDPE